MIYYFFHGKCKSPCIIAADCSLRKKQNMKKSNLISNIVKVHNQPDGVEV